MENQLNASKTKNRKAVWIGAFVALTAVLLLLLWQWQNAAQSDAALTYKQNQTQSLAKVGDIIARQGVGAESAVIRQLSGSPYSHVGLVVQVTPFVSVVHAATDDYPDRSDRVVLSPLDHFTDPTRAKSWALFRYDALSDDEVNALVVQTLGRRDAPFALYPKGTPSDGVYCATLIADALPKRLTEQLRWQSVDLIGLKGEYLYPNALVDPRVGARLVYDSQEDF